MLPTIETCSPASGSSALTNPGPQTSGAREDGKSNRVGGKMLQPDVQSAIQEVEDISAQHGHVGSSAAGRSLSRLGESRVDVNPGHGASELRTAGTAPSHSDKSCSRQVHTLWFCRRDGVPRELRE